jgi:hypothetical protein
MGNFAQGEYSPKNPAKYIGKKRPRYRSGWELFFMNFCDNDKRIQYWASEAISITYRHPVTGKATQYIPDFFVVYEDKKGKNKAEIVEIKPKKQSLIESKVTSARDRIIVAINHAKWAAARAYCAAHGYTFRVVTEDDLFHTGRRVARSSRRKR